MSGTGSTAMPERLRILAADLSLRRPGFAVLQYEGGKVSIERLCHLDNRKSRAGHGEILSAIYNFITGQSPGIDVFVRERAFSRFPQETQALFKVVGIADMAVWEHAKQAWEEIAPTTIKKLLTGSGKAAKEEVARAQERYVGCHNYKIDDESDAAAAGIAWLLHTHGNLEVQSYNTYWTGEGRKKKRDLRAEICYS